MSIQKGLKLIAIGTALSDRDRQTRVNSYNNLIDSYADSIRSSSDVDGMPHGNMVTDQVASRGIKIEKVEAKRDVQQERLNAVVWAEQYVRDIFKEEDGDTLIQAIYMHLSHRTKEAIALIESKTSITPSSFYYAKEQFLVQILSYLNYI